MQSAQNYFSLYNLDWCAALAALTTKRLRSLHETPQPFDTRIIITLESNPRLSL